MRRVWNFTCHYKCKSCMFVDHQMWVSTALVMMLCTTGTLILVMVPPTVTESNRSLPACWGSHTAHAQEQHCCCVCLLPPRVMQLPATTHNHDVEGMKCIMIMMMMISQCIMMTRTTPLMQERKHHDHARFEDLQKITLNFIVGVGRAMHRDISKVEGKSFVMGQQN